MNPENPKPSSTVAEAEPSPSEVRPHSASALDDSSRCQHRTRSGRRCRQPFTDARSRLCFDHARTFCRQHASAELAASLTGELTSFQSTQEINQVLSNLLLALAHDRIPPRRAAVIAYTCNLLLRTITVNLQETRATQEAPQIIFDLPRPERD